MRLQKIVKSTKSDKKMMAVFDHKTVHFGQRDSKTYLDHHDRDKRSNYISRHRINEKWNEPDTAGSLSRWILWGNSTSLNENIKDFKKKFNL